MLYRREVRTYVHRVKASIGVQKTAESIAGRVPVGVTVMYLLLSGGTKHPAPFKPLAIRGKGGHGAGQPDMQETQQSR